MNDMATPTLDDALGGVLPGRIHLITGAPGSGKTAACLHFLRSGAKRGERGVLVTNQRGADLRSLALYVGVDLHTLVRDRKVTLLRYRPRFTSQVIATATPHVIVDELREAVALDDLAQLSNAGTPLRIVIDPVSPFVPAADITGAALDALTEWLETSNATALLTWTGDMPIGTDRRLEPLVDRAAMILHVERIARGSFQAHVLRARHEIANAAPIAFEVVPGLGMSSAPMALLRQPFAADGRGAQPAA